MKLHLLAATSLLAALAALAAPASVAAEEDGPFMVRLRGVYILTANKSDAIPALSVPADATRSATS
jgi:outer membrane protein W